MKIRALWRATAVGMSLLILTAGIAVASDVDVAVVDVTVPTNSVTLAPGGSGNITINMSVNGNQAGTATFEVYRDWSLSGGSFIGSNPQEFTVGPRGGGDPATTFSTSGTVSVAIGHASGTFTLAVGAFDITNSNTTGAKLAAGDASNYQVTVSAPADSTPPDTSITAQPSNPTSSTSASFSFNGSDNVTPAGSLTFECSLDGAVFAACTSPRVYAGPLAESSHNFQVRAKDAANNVDPTPASYTWTIDTSGPSIICSPPDDTIWYGNNVTVNCTASDANDLQDPPDASFFLSTNVTPGSENASASTGSKTVNDSLGNSSTAGPYTFMVDRKAPVIICGSADGIWHASDVSISCTASDGGSGLADAADSSFSLSTTVAAGSETNNASTGSKNVADAVGNSATAGPISGNMVDKKGPVVTLTCPSIPVFLGSSASASWSATDGGSGVNGSDTGSVTLNTTSVGSKTASLVAGSVVDNVANGSAAATCNYSVIYNWTGFFRPVDNPGTVAPLVVNTAKAGQAIPVKFSLGGNQGLGIFANGYPLSLSVTLPTGVDADPIEDYATLTAGQSALQYDALTDTYTYVWKTDKTWAGKARKLVVKLVDGTEHVAYFNFTK